MSRKPFDAYCKDFLDEFLAPTGEVTTGREVRDEARQIDVWYVPNPRLNANRQQLGLLGRMAAQPCVFEPYSQRPGLNEVRSCILKLMVTLLETVRTAKREQRSLPIEEELPMLWILSPSASPTLVENIGGKPRPSWPDGVFIAVGVLRTGFVAIDRLPETPDTLWLRLLGRGRTLERAIAELIALPPSEPKRDRAVQLLANWKTNIEGIGGFEAEDQELVMTLSPAFIEWEQRTRQAGFEEGIQRVRVTLQGLLVSRFGRIDNQLEAVIEYFTELNSEDYAQQLPLLLSLSRDELVTRFGAQPTDGDGVTDR